MEDQRENLVRVTIFGQEYTVKAKANVDYIADVAKHVDREMRKVEEGLPSSQSAMRIAILAAMSITDELFSSRRESDRILDQVEHKTASLVEAIEEATPSP
ncbi:MAG: cell division protein ZapA [Fidelibacterota bacterium]